MTDIPIDSNVGGYFGPFLKFSGFDVIELTGKAEEDVIIVIDGNKGTVSIEKAPLEHKDAHVLQKRGGRMLRFGGGSLQPLYVEFYIL